MITRRLVLGVVVAVAVAGVGVGTLALAERPERPTPRFKPAETPMVLSEPTEVEVMKDGAKVKVKAFTIPGTKPLRLVELDQAKAPASFHKSRPKQDLPPPFFCSDMDEQGHKGAAKSNCYFTRMPYYSQLNPNLAFVDVPESIYQAEKHPVTGPLAWDDAANHWAVLLDIGSTKTPDPFYASWLPLGPHPGDPGSLGGASISDLCGPTSESMALMAALSNKTDKSKVHGGSWLEDSFIKAKRPKGQEPLPKPLKQDHGSLAPGGQQMTEEEIQRVINLSVLQKTDPTGGGADADFVSETALKGVDWAAGGDKQAYHVKTGKFPSTHDVVEAVRDAHVPVITLGRYEGTFKAHKDAAGKVTKWTVTLKRTGGHFLAVNGFSDGDTKDEALLIFDPEGGSPYPKTFLKLHLKGAKSKDGVPIEVLLEGKSGTAPVGEDHWPVWESKSTDLMNLQDSKARIKVIENYKAIRID